MIWRKTETRKFAQTYGTAEQWLFLACGGTIEVYYTNEVLKYTHGKCMCLCTQCTANCILVAELEKNDVKLWIVPIKSKKDGTEFPNSFKIFARRYFKVFCHCFEFLQKTIAIIRNFGWGRGIMYLRPKWIFSRAQYVR